MNEIPRDDCEAIEQLADSFVARFRVGDTPNIDEFVERHPELADQLRNLLPAIVLLERHAAACVPDRLGRQAESAASPTPQEIGDFTIVREIGRGGMGVVYEAVQQSLSRHVALKVLAIPALVNTKHLERFRFEARAAARLQHRHIVPVFGVGELDGLHYYAMQFIHGQSLHEVLSALKDRGAVNEAAPAASTKLAGLTLAPTASREFYRNIARIGQQVAEALAYAHSEGVLHRDIKPSNLLLDAHGNVWVTDFGLAKTEGMDGLTETGDFVGTLRYMAPERLEGVLDRRSDIYSLGASLYELLTLQSFFETNSNAQLVDQILNESPPAPSRLQRSIPRELETIVLKAIAKEPTARYRTAEEMAEDLRRYLADKPILSRRPAATEQLVRWCRRNPLVATLAGTVAFLLVAAVIILTWSNARIHSEVATKDKAMASARDAVHQLLTRVASEKLSDIPMSHPLRVELLEDALKAYEGLLALGDEDVVIRNQMAEVLHTIAGLERELDRNVDAANALKRSAAMYALLVPLDPAPPTIRESLAVVEMDLAYTWQFDTNSPDHKLFPVESQYRRALAMFEGIERDWPGRRQPVTLCLRSLAEFAHRRGDKATAEQFWRDSISRGETFLQLHPTKFQVRNDLCWACIEYYERILSRSPDRTSEAEAMLAQGVKHAHLMQNQNPQSNQAADVMSALHMRQALVCCSAGRIDDAIPIFRVAIREIQALCESVPWNTDYWNTAQWFHLESIRNLHQAKRSDEIDTLLKQTTAWLRKIAARGSGDELQRRKMIQMQTALIKLLRSIGRDREADEFADIVK